MSRALTPNSSLDNLKKDAKRWHKALKAGDADARARLVAALPDAPVAPTLRDVQLALAREYGLSGWADLRRALEDIVLDRAERRALADDLLRQGVFQGEPEIAARILARRPDVAEVDLYTAVAAGRLEDVRRRLAADPASATRAGGPLGWEPIQYLAYLRLPGAEEHAVEVASLLLDNGADPNAVWKDPWDNPFKLVTGLIGEGEGVKPPHAKADELVALLLARGADPLDTQAFYDTSITFDETKWLDVLWTAAEARGQTERWRAVTEGYRIGGRHPVSPLDFMLGLAVSQHHVRRAEWLLAHGADPNGVAAYTGRSMCEEALVHGDHEMAELLERAGAEPRPPTPKTAFLAACRAMDRDAARALVEAHPEFLTDAETMIAAARHGRVDVVGLLLELGVDVDVKDQGGVRAIHVATGNGRMDVLRLLIERGADVDTPTQHYGGAMGAAAHFKQREAGALLAPLSRDVWNLTSLGLKDRLAELFAEEPALVNAPHFRFGFTPLFALPDDEDAAADMAAFLLAHGADPAARNRDGRTPEAEACRRGLDDAADVIAGESGG